MKKFLVAAIAALTLATGFSADASARDRGRHTEEIIVIDRNHGPRFDDRRGGRGEWRHERRHRVLPAHVIVRALYRQGFADVLAISRVRNDYVARAVRHNGKLMRLRVDGATGRVIARETLGWRGGRHGGHGRPGFGFTLQIR